MGMLGRHDTCGATTQDETLGDAQAFLKEGAIQNSPFLSIVHQLNTSGFDGVGLLQQGIDLLFEHQEQLQNGGVSSDLSERTVQFFQGFNRLRRNCHLEEEVRRKNRLLAKNSSTPLVPVGWRTQGFIPSYC
jgi:hypothetical protein